MLKIDLNCDMGESFGVYHLGADAVLLEHVTSANIACGFHAGDPSVMRSTVKLALQKGAAIGAHPGLPDLAGFGRRNMDISPDEAFDIVTYQIGALQMFVKQEGGVLHHVKPHGALYNMAATSKALADAIAAAVYAIDSNLILYGLSGSAMIEAGQQIGLGTASEVFADRTYQDDGTLTPRRMTGSLIIDKEHAVQQVLGMVKDGYVKSISGKSVPIQADTVCIHGDGAHAVMFAQQLGARLLDEGIIIQTVGKVR